MIVPVQSNPHAASLEPNITVKIPNDEKSLIEVEWQDEDDMLESVAEDVKAISLENKEQQESLGQAVEQQPTVIQGHSEPNTPAADQRVNSAKTTQQSITPSKPEPSQLTVEQQEQQLQ